MNETPAMHISVVLATHNRALLLDRALGCLARQTLPPEAYEVVVVLDGCTDHSAAVCGKWKERIRHFCVVELRQNQGQPSAANRGWEAAQTGLIVFTDDDCLPEPDWLEKMARALSCSPAVAGAVATSLRPFYTLCHNIAQFHEYMPGRSLKPRFAAGANFGIQRKLLLETNGFSTDPQYRLVPDMALSLALLRRGYRIHYEPEAAIVHQPDRCSLSALLRYAAAHAAASIHLRRAYCTELRTPFILKSAVLLLLLSPFIACGATALIFVRNPSLRGRLYAAPVVFLTKLAWCSGAALSLRRQSVMPRPAANCAVCPEGGKDNFRKAE